MSASVTINRALGSAPLSADVNSSFWQPLPSCTLGHFMGERPAHFPGTRFKLAYDDRHLFLLFEVRDRYVRAMARQHQDPVYRDSCVELFLTPGRDLSRGYFNLEINCGGFVLFHYQAKDSARQVLQPELCAQLGIAHSAPARIEKEITDPFDWCVEVTVPLSVLARFTVVDQPGPGVVWRGNAYKCADDSSHPHWLTWAPVDYPEPNFHLPEYFGEFVFD